VIEGKVKDQSGGGEGGRHRLNSEGGLCCVWDWWKTWWKLVAGRKKGVMKKKQDESRNGTGGSQGEAQGASDPGVVGVRGLVGRGVAGGVFRGQGKGEEKGRGGSKKGISTTKSAQTAS